MVAYAWYVFEPGRVGWPFKVDYIDVDAVLMRKIK